MWGFEFSVNLFLRGWGDWSEGKLKCRCDLIRGLYDLGTIPWCAGFTVSSSLPCFGLWHADLKGLYQLASLSSGFRLEGPRGVPAGEPWREESETKCLLVVSLQGRHSSVTCPSNTDFFDFGSNSHTFPHLFWPTGGSDCIPYHCNLPCGFQISAHK